MVTKRNGKYSPGGSLLKVRWTGLRYHLQSDGQKYACVTQHKSAIRVQAQIQKYVPEERLTHLSGH